MSCFRRGFRRLFGSSQRRVLLLGLDAAGKTTLLYQFMVNILLILFNSSSPFSSVISLTFLTHFNVCVH
jgi:GTPase SAR1 family protein